MRRFSAVDLVGLVAALPLLGACGTDTLVDVETESASLVSAQCDAQASRAAVDACFATFETCRTAAGAVEADCRAALDACLPEGVPHRARPRGPGHGPGDGGCHGGGGEGDGPHGPPPGGPPRGGPDGLRPPPPDGGFGPGHPGGRGRGHGRGPGGPGRGGRGPVQLDEAAAASCRTASRACLEAGTDEATCRDQARLCLHDAFEAAFTARCAELTAACAANLGMNCDELTARCAEGVRPPPTAACGAAVETP
ncbi:MAG: hypothetical protein JNJ54_33545 [Myxococcaceae bacterium]|nr:hypothetical protein [Myxococcaceae bacterium]